MALTAQQLALRMAKHIGVTSFDPNDPSNLSPVFNRGLQPGDFEELVACINAALQEIWSRAPTAAGHSRLRSTLPGPMATTLQLTQGSTAITGFPDYASWMPGCTVVIAGGAEHNEVIDATMLRDPYHGATGAVTAQIYADCVTLPPEAVSLQEPLECNRIGRAPELIRLVRSYEEYQQEEGAALRKIGVPEAAHLESRFVFATGRHTVRLRITPMPMEPVVLSYGLRLNVPTIEPPDLSVIPDPGKRLPLPGGWDESVLLPLANRRLATHPDFHSLTNALRLEIGEQARTAHRIMQNSSADRSAETLRPTFR